MPGRQRAKVAISTDDLHEEGAKAIIARLALKVRPCQHPETSEIEQFGYIWRFTSARGAGKTS
jgi:hypothetical protein